MKTITLHFSDKALSELKTTMTIRGMAGALYGMTDELMMKIVNALDNGTAELKLRLKEEGDKT